MVAMYRMIDRVNANEKADRAALHILPQMKPEHAKKAIGDWVRLANGKETPERRRVELTPANFAMYFAKLKAQEDKQNA